MRLPGFEPGPAAWGAAMLPLHHRRLINLRKDFYKAYELAYYAKEEYRS